MQPLLENFFLLAPPAQDPLIGYYNPIWVLLSIFVAIFASYTALDLARRIAHSEGAEFWLWYVGGSLSMGAGIWSMHFVGMLAFHLPVPMTYELDLTLLSLLLAFIAAAFVLGLLKKPQLTHIQLTGAGILLGLGIATMHYTGMAAMKMPALIRYQPSWFILSVLIGIFAAWLALRLTFSFSRYQNQAKFWQQLGTGSILGLGLRPCIIRG